MPALILGCGNPDRGDDAAGVLAARRLRELGFNAREHRGEGLSLMEAWRGYDLVILIDAVSSGAKPGSVFCWDVSEVPLARDQFRCSSHAFGVAEAIELGRELNQLPARLWILGIEGAGFTAGAAPSSEVAAALPRTVAVAAALVENHPA